LWNFIKDNKIIFSIVLIVLGLFICFLGRKFIKVTLFLAGILITVGVIMAVVIALFFDENTSSTPLWIVLGCSTLLGIGVGYLISRDTA
jgi:hypothetical protein